MKALLSKTPGGPDSLVLEDVPSPTNDEDLLSINHMDFTTEDSAGPSTQRHRRSSISTRLQHFFPRMLRLIFSPLCFSTSHVFSHFLFFNALKV